MPDFALLLRRAMLVALVALAVAPFASAADASLDAKLSFDVPGGDARQMLRKFATQAKCELVFPVDLVGGLRTNAVKGEFTVRDALGTMLAGTGLAASVDEKTGALALRRLDAKAESKNDGLRHPERVTETIQRSSKKNLDDEKVELPVFEEIGRAHV